MSELNDPKYKYFRQNNNPLDVVYKEKAKFDVQNPIIGDLLNEINKGKLTDEEYYKTAPDIKDLDIKERFDKIFGRETKKKDNNLDNISDDNDDNGRSPPGSPGLPPRPPTIQGLFPHEYNNPFNVDLNNLEQEYIMIFALKQQKNLCN